jgi:hypothetical protein
LPVTTAAWALLVALGVGHLTEATFGFSTSTRVAITVAVIAPGALLLGFFFPLGLRLVARIAPAANAWMWGVNGACGVLASVGAVMVSLWAGIGANLLLGAAAYLSLSASSALLARRVAR